MNTGCNPNRGSDLLVESYLEHLETRRFSTHYRAEAARVLPHFLSWTHTHPAAVDLPLLEAYAIHLTGLPGRHGQANPQTVAKKLGHLRGFFRWLTATGKLAADPAAGLALPRQPRTQPRIPLTHTEIKRLLQVPDLRHPWGIRDRTAMEVLYATGMRASELCRLQLHELDLAAGLVRVNHGKGGKDRLVPIGGPAVAWTTRYLEEARPHYLRHQDQDPGTLLLTNRGKPMVVDNLYSAVHRHMRRAGIRKEGACHLFRHSMATHMLENGADIRIIQAILGHANIDNTAIYTKVSRHGLKQVHTATHPANQA